MTIREPKPGTVEGKAAVAGEAAEARTERMSAQRFPAPVVGVAPAGRDLGLGDVVVEGEVIAVAPATGGLQVAVDPHALIWRRSAAGRGLDSGATPETSCAGVAAWANSAAPSSTCSQWPSPEPLRTRLNSIGPSPLSWLARPSSHMFCGVVPASATI